VTKEQKKKYQRKYRRDHKEEIQRSKAKYHKEHAKQEKAQRKKYYWANKKRLNKRVNAWAKKNREENPGYYMTKHRKYKYGLLEEDYNRMVCEQGGRCYICGKLETVKSSGKRQRIRELGVDHNHKTGKVRKLLCARCNSVIGFVDEDIMLVEKILSYLREFNACV
jgi:hypothetical protein